MTDDMAEPVKFTFDQAFDGGAKSRYDLELERLVEDNKQAQTSAHSQGFEEGRQQALNEIEAATKDALEHMAQAAHALFSQQRELEANLKLEMVQLSYTIASKLAPAMIRTKPLTEIEALIEDCMVTAHKEPRLVVRVDDAVADAVSDRIEDMKASTNFPGDIVLIGESGMGPQDCRVEWPDGGSDRRHEETLKEIENAVQRFVMSGTDKSSKHNKAHDETAENIDEQVVGETDAPTQRNED